jgi:mono/diheme cytochrome c family protein
VLIALLLCSACAGSPQSSIANGRAIFQSGRNVDGVQITARNKPLFQKCSACHKADGSGGKRFADGAVSADLRAGTLAKDNPRWTIALLERAISKGIDNEGKPLDPVMPRWTMSKRDLHDVSQYVLTQLK